MSNKNKISIITAEYIGGTSFVCLGRVNSHGKQEKSITVEAKKKVFTQLHPYKSYLIDIDYLKECIDELFPVEDQG